MSAQKPTLASRYKDSISGLILLLLATGYYRLTLAIPSSSLSDEVGADGLPRLLAWALGIIAILMIVKGLMAAASSASNSENDKDECEYEHAPLLRALGFIAIGIGYMALAPQVGFAAGITALIIAVALYEKQAFSLKLLAVAACGGLGFWFVFVYFLGAEQPFSALLSLIAKR